MVTVIVSSTTAAPHRIDPQYYKKVDLRWRFWFWAPSARGILPRPTCSDHQAIHHQLTSDVCRQPSYSAGNCDVRRCVQGTQTAAPHVSLRRRQIWSSGGWDAVRDVCPPSIDWRGVEVGVGSVLPGLIATGVGGIPSWRLAVGRTSARAQWRLWELRVGLAPMRTDTLQVADLCMAAEDQRDWVMADGRFGY